VDYVIHDGWRGGFELTTRLIQQGHKRITFAISDEVLPTSVHDRLAGYRAALEKYGLTYDENLVWVNVIDLIHPERKHKTEFVLEKEFYDHLYTERTTGLVAVNFPVAKFLREHIYLKPLEAGMSADYMKTIEICSFSGQLKPVYEPYISYLALQPGEPIGIAAAEIMVDRLRKNGSSTPRQIKLPMEIVDMKSLKYNMESNT
jgi:DNA-binding LacI/PurR family transcriptional regulator